MSAELSKELISKIRDVRDFPKKGIVFRDITTLVKDPGAFKKVIDYFYDQFKDMKIDYIAAIESRGFVFGSALAYMLGCGIIPIRKPGKLPAKVIKAEYKLEYGTDSLEVHEDAIEPGKRVLIIDDLLATGGTVAAACELVKKLKANTVGIAFVIHLTFLNGLSKLPNDCKIVSIVSYDSE